MEKGDLGAQLRSGNGQDPALSRVQCRPLLCLLDRPVGSHPGLELGPWEKAKLTWLGPHLCSGILWGIRQSDTCHLRAKDACGCFHWDRRKNALSSS